MKIGSYLSQSTQIYFPASLEIQRELIQHGYGVPKPTPIPLIYSNSGGWITQPPPITIERLIDPQLYGQTPTSLGWRTTLPVRGRQAFILPPEQSFLTFEINKDVILYIDVKKYHLERTSIRGVNPEKWKNWIAFYLSLDDFEDLENKLGTIPPRGTFSVKHERLPGFEDTYYVYASPKDRDFGLDCVKDFTICAGCFNFVLAYLNRQPPGVARSLKLRLVRDPSIPVYLKAGIAKVGEKHPQFMIKLASSQTMTISGQLKPIIEGKARGRLDFCNHLKPDQKIVLDHMVFSQVIGFWKHVIDTRSFSLLEKARLRVPSWLP
jgi:hypothetical protein